MLWEELVVLARKMQVPEKLVFLEETQKAILTALSHRGCFDSVVFQGGTALRLFHGNIRFSEDIDLVLREGIREYALEEHLSSIKRFTKSSFPFLENVSVEVQKRTPEIQRCVLRTRSDIPEQRLRVHIELAGIPSYHNRPRILQYPPLQPVVRVEDPEEILADKVTALALRPYLKGRDLWDIYYLVVERDLSITWNLVYRKVLDYGFTRSEYVEKMEKTLRKLNLHGENILKNELERFLPARIFEEYRFQLPDMLETIMRLTSVDKNSGGDDNEGQ